jgi:acetyltransferase-like isoleucine patch superfamily enzyme
MPPRLAVLPARVWVHGGGTICLGSRVRLDVSMAPIELHVEPAAEIFLGDDVYVAGGSSIEAQRSVRVGARCRIGPFCKIMDGHFHTPAGDRDRRPPPVAVVVEDDVEIGPHCVLLPRTHLGAGSMLRAGTVVSRRFPPGVVLGGIPAVVCGRARGKDDSP